MLSVSVPFLSLTVSSIGEAILQLLKSHHEGFVSGFRILISRCNDLSVPRNLGACLTMCI